MTNEEAQRLIERVLLIPIHESDAALILAGIETQLRNEAAQLRVQLTDGGLPTSDNESAPSTIRN